MGRVVYVSVRMSGLPVYPSGDASSLSFHQDIQEGDLSVNFLLFCELDWWMLGIEVVMEGV